MQNKVPSNEFSTPSVLIYLLKRVNDALYSDVLCNAGMKIIVGMDPYKFHGTDSAKADIKNETYYVLAVRINSNNVLIEMIDEKTGESWDKGIIK